MMNMTADKILRRFGIGRVIRNVFNTHYTKKCLIRYITKPFVEEGLHSHQNSDHVQAIAKTISNMEYNVDVVDFETRHAMLRGKYDLIFEITVCKTPIYIRHIKRTTKKVVYLTGSEPSFSNKAELKRLDDAKKRRGVKFKPRRQVEEFPGEIEQYDKVIIIGNQQTLSTYTRKYIFRSYNLISNTGYTFNRAFDLNKKKRNCFLFLGSSGCIHKGLDLLLEIFSEDGFPAELFVCGYYEQETDFYQEYKEELCSRGNIHALGYVDIFSQRFEEILDMCCFTILPSCSEGQSGTITTCMAAGLIPVCSKECGYDRDDVIVLPDCEKSTIRETILRLTEMDMHDISNMCQKSKELIKQKYNLDVFRKKMETILRDVR